MNRDQEKSLIQKLYDEKGGLFKSLRDLQTKADTEQRGYTSEDIAEDDRMAKRLSEVTEEIQRRERNLKLAENLEDRAGDTDPKPVAEKVAATLNEYRASRGGGRVEDTPEYRAAFFRWVSSVDDRSLDHAELRVLSKASAGAGANLVPTAFRNLLVDSLREYGVMRQLSNVITTDTGEALQHATVTTHGTAAWTAENAAFTLSDEAFGTLTLNAYKAATIMIVSEELLQDSAFDLEAFIRAQFGIRIGILENTAYMVGDGSAKPTGLVPSLTLTSTAAGAAAITGVDLIKLQHKVIAPYRNNGVFLMKDSSFSLIRQIVDTTGQFILQPGLQLNAPDVLLGRPVYVDPDMPAATTGLRSVVFGDIRAAYTIRDVNGVSFQRLEELYALNGQVGFRAYHRTDGKVVDANAAAVLVQA